MKIYELIIEGYREAEDEFTAVTGDSAGVKGLIQTYRDLVNKNQVKGDERNIDFWRKQGYDAFSKFVVDKSSVPTTTQVKRKKLPGKSITLREDDNWLIVIPLDKNASCFHGKDSDWCTTKPNDSYFEQYFYDKEITLIYCLNKQTGGMWAIAAHPNLSEIEMFDQRDNHIDGDTFEQQTGLDPYSIVRDAHTETNVSTTKGHRVGYNDAMDELIRIRNATGFAEQDPNVERLLELTKSKELCNEYIQGIYQYQGYVRVKVPNAILLAACQQDISILNLVDLSGYSDGFVLRLMTKFDAVSPIIRSGYKPSEKFIDSLLSSTTTRAEKSQYVTDMLRYGIGSPEKYMLDILTNPNVANRVTQYYKDAGVVPTDKVQQRLVGMNAFNISYLLEMGIKPSESVINVMIDATDDCESEFYNLARNGVPIPRDCILRALNKEKDMYGEEETLAMYMSAIVRGKQIPPVDLLLRADKVNPGKLAKLMFNRHMQIPTELMDVYPG